MTEIVPRIAVMKDRFENAYPSEKANLKSAQVISIKEAFSKAWDSDAHAMLYVPKTGDYSTRVLKAYFKNYQESVTPLQVELFIADCDNVPHGPWSEESLREHVNEISKTSAFDGLGIYYTRNGYRVFQQLSAPFVLSRIDVAEYHLMQWFNSLIDKGLEVDLNCKDITHLFRLPNVVRDRQRYTTTILDFSRMSPYTLDILDSGIEEDLEDITPNKPIPVVYNIPNWKNELPDDYDKKAKIIAQELLRIQDPWHPIYLAIAGALQSRGTPAELLPMVCRQIAFHARDSRPEDRFAVGRTTAVKRFNGCATRGSKYLYDRYPELARAIDVAFGLYKEEPPSFSKKEIDYIYEDMKDTISNAENGVTVMKVSVGAGKTTAALEVAINREKDGFKTSISVDKNALAKQIHEDIKIRGTEANRIFGALSLKDAIGNPVCIHHDVAQNLAEGGQSISYELCQGRNDTKCIMYETCEARKGFEGFEDSNIMISNHNKLSQLSEHTGTKGLLVIDEPKSFVATYKIKPKEKELIRSRIGNFEYRFVKHIQEYIFRIISWTNIKTEKPMSFEELTKDIDLSPILGEETRHKTGVPPIKIEYVQLLKNKPEIAKEIGKVSKFIYLLYRAKTEKSIVRLEDDDVISITLYDEDMYNALTKDGPVIVTDANADLYKEQIEKITGVEPGYCEHKIGDNVPMERLLLRTKGANRKKWICYNNVIWNNVLEECLEHIIEWYHKTGGGKLSIITFYQLEAALRKKENDISKRILELDPLIAHYYNTRGMNNFIDYDCLVTLGDPWKNRGIIRNELEFFNIDINKMKWYEIESCKAEIYQSHGRLRPSRRTKPGRLLHVGSVTPSEWTRDNSSILTKPKSGSSLYNGSDVDKLIRRKGMTQREFAKIIKMDPSQLSRTIKDNAAISIEQAKLLRSIL